MKPQAYLDIRAFDAPVADEAGDHPSIDYAAEFATNIATVGRIMWVLHGAMRAAPGVYALAFPQWQEGVKRMPGGHLRVFAESRAALQTLTNNVGAHRIVRDYAHLGYAKIVPAGFAGPYYEYRRFRLPGKSSRLQRSEERRVGKECA